VSWYAGTTSWFTGLKYYCDNASIGYYYGQELVGSSKEASKALFDVKSDMGANMNGYWGSASWMNLFDFNLYGDPTTSLVISGSSSCPEYPADGVITNVTYPAGPTCTCTNTTSITVGAGVIIESGATVIFTAATSITVGAGVTIESGATVIFTAPTVTLQPGFHAENGATVDIRQ